MTRRSLLVPAILATGLAARAARAQDRDADHRFFTRLALGTAALAGSTSLGPVSYAYLGGGGGVSVEIGSAISPSVVFYGELLDAATVAPQATLNGTSEGGPVDARFDGVGPGVRDYLTSNLYLGATLMLAEFSVGKDLRGAGWGASASVGDDLWVAGRHHVGLTLQLLFSSMPARSGSDRGTWVIGGALLGLSIGLD